MFDRSPVDTDSTTSHSPKRTPNMSEEPSAQPLCLKALPDFVTVATAADGKLMTKIFFVDSEGREQFRSYDKCYFFNFSTPAIACLDDLARVLDGLDRHSCVIYGRLIEGTVTPCRRLKNADAETGDPATIEDAAHSWLLLDIDGIETSARSK